MFFITKRSSITRSWIFWANPPWFCGLYFSWIRWSWE